MYMQEKSRESSREISKETLRHGTEIPFYFVWQVLVMMFLVSERTHQILYRPAVVFSKLAQILEEQRV